MTTTAEQIMHYAQSLPEGATLTAKELLHLGERAAIDQALTRLVRTEKLYRLGRGLYAAPVVSRFGSAPPAPLLVLEHLSKFSGERFSINGAMSANKLGLSLQNPIQSQFLTSGKTRKMQFGLETVFLESAPGWQLLCPHTKPGHAVRALAWFGPPNARKAVKEIGQSFTEEERLELLMLRRETPAWMSKEISQLAA